MKHILFIVLLLHYCASAVSAQEPPPARVKTKPISQREIAENKGFLGLLYYERVSNVSSEIAGLVEDITIRTGDRVNEGDVLVQLNTELLEKEILLAQTRIKQIEARTRHAEKLFQRLQSLLEQKGTSKQKFEDAEFDLLDAQLEQQAARETLAKLALEKKKSIIKAPFTGIVMEKQVDRGDWVGQGKGLVTLAAADELFVRVPVGENLIRFIQPGQQLDVTLNAFDRKITGTLKELAPRADARTKNIFLKVHIPEQPMVAENMSATVFVPISENKTLSMIPRDALIKFQGKDFVYTIKEGKASILPVNIVSYLDSEVGADNPYFVPGLPVVVEGNERLRPDQSVIVAGEEQ